MGKVIRTLGEKRVRTGFNPSNENYVDELKHQAAKFIDAINEAAPNPEFTDETVREWMRLKALAMTAAEEAALWAVKAATITNVKD